MSGKDVKTLSRSSRTGHGMPIVAISVVSLFAIAHGNAHLAAQQRLYLPFTPEPREWILDRAELLDEEARAHIRAVQERSFQHYDTPIVVLTIPSKKSFGASGMPIEEVARQLFDRWEIGKRNAAGNLINQGILLLVSISDRKARIQLGDDWGHRWDDRANQIMQESIIPNFKAGDFATGITAGVDELAQMAEQGPDGQPAFRLMRFLNSKPARAISPLPLWGTILTTLTGILSIVAGIYLPRLRKPLVIVGLALIIVGFAFWPALALLYGFVRHWQSGDSGFSGGGLTGGGGFDVGGFSGGGGATGSW